MYLTLSTRLGRFDLMHPENEETEVRICVRDGRSHWLQLILQDNAYEPPSPAEHLVDQALAYLDLYLRYTQHHSSQRVRDAIALKTFIQEHEREIRRGCIGVAMARLYEKQSELEQEQARLGRLAATLDKELTEPTP